MACAVLMVVLDGDVGTLLLQASMRSFAAPAGVSGFFLADLSSPSKQLDIPAGMPGLRVFRMPRAPKDSAFQHLRQEALAAGYTHGLLAYSHEIFKRQEDSQVVEHLPAGWEAVDVYQAVSNVRRRRNVDVLVNLRRFAILGPVSPAPIPLTLQESLTARPWQDVCVDAYEHAIPRTAAMDQYLQALARLEEFAGAPLFALGFLQHQVALGAVQARLYKEANSLLQRRIKAAAHGWAEEDGWYWALALRTECIEAMRWPLDKSLPDLFAYANLGLAMGRLEGVLRMHYSLVRHKSQALLVYALATLATFPESLHENSWMGDALAYTTHLREALGRGMLQMAPTENEAAASEQMYSASRHPAARLETELQTLYKRHASREGDSAPCTKWFPAPDDLLLPEIVKVDAFMDAGRAADMVAAVNPARAWSWLRILFSNAIRSPYCMLWGGEICNGTNSMSSEDVCVRVCTPATHEWMFTQWCTGTKGYTFLLSLHAAGRVRTANGDDLALPAGSLLCLRAGVQWTPSAAVLVAQLEFPHFS